MCSHRDVVGVAVGVDAVGQIDAKFLDNGCRFGGGWDSAGEFCEEKEAPSQAQENAWDASHWGRECWIEPQAV